MSADLQAENDRLRAALEAIVEKGRRSSESWYPGREFPTEFARNWHDGFISAFADCSIKARAALDPEQAADDDDTWIAASGTDREWFERTGNCGHCANIAGDCVCTDDDPCGCGPHEPRTWPKPCWRCNGTGVLDPIHGRFVTGQPALPLVEVSA